MLIEASVENWDQHHAAVVATGAVTHRIDIPHKANGPGSSINGGEALCLALATCYCNDIYREAKQRGIEVLRVNVDVQAEFGGVGEPAKSMSYRARVAAKADEQTIRALMLHTDRVAEIQATLRKGMPVHFEAVEAITEG
ncbi:MAG TPA: OsmC family protein [Gammaproteobacteria bacterium]|jgi:organic hydroperoxide reductase OsmC/OhrA